MMNEDAPVCYGKYPKCELATCEFSASCEYYTVTPAEIRPIYATGVRGDESWLPEAARKEQQNTDEVCSPPVTREELVVFFKWLMSLDEYTLGVLQHAYSSGAEHTSLAEIARTRGCSRQAVYRKMEDSIEEYPELFALATKLFGHMKKSKTKFLRTSALRAGRKNNSKNPKETKEWTK